MVFLRRGLEFLEQEYAHYLESEMGKGMAMGEPQELSPVLSYSRHQQLAAFGSDMEEVFPVVLACVAVLCVRVSPFPGADLWLV